MGEVLVRATCRGRFYLNCNVFTTKIGLNHHLSLLWLGLTDFSWSYLVLQGSQVSLQPLVLAQQGLDAGQVPAKVVGGHELLLLLDPADGLVHIPGVESTMPEAETPNPNSWSH